MVVLTIEAPSNDYTVYFDQPIPKPNYIKLLNCSLYNSWYNLKKNVKFTFMIKRVFLIVGQFFQATILLKRYLKK